MEWFLIYINEVLMVYCATRDFWFSCLFEIINACENVCCPDLQVSLEDFFLQNMNLVLMKGTACR